MVCSQEAELWQAVCPLLLLQTAELLENSMITEMTGTEMPALTPWCTSAGYWHFVALTPSQT